MEGSNLDEGSCIACELTREVICGGRGVAAETMEEVGRLLLFSKVRGFSLGAAKLEESVPRRETEAVGGCVDGPKGVGVIILPC